MGFTNIMQVRELFLSCGMGFLLGTYYDVFRILRCILRPGAARVFWQDILFFVTAAPLVFLFTLAVTDGVVRFYLFAGLVAGFFAYRYTVGRAVVRFVTAVIARLSRMGRRLYGVIRVPFGVLSEVCRNLMKKIQKNLKKLKKTLETKDTSSV